jgi:hypothetical protein
MRIVAILPLRSRKPVGARARSENPYSLPTNADIKKAAIPSIANQTDG